MRRLKSILLLLGVLLLGGAISVIFVGRQHRRSWAQTLAQTEIEREALFDLRDALDVDLDAVARLQEFLSDEAAAVRRRSSHAGWAANVFNLARAAPVAKHVDHILRRGRTYLASWLLIPRDASDDIIVRSRTYFRRPLHRVVWYWHQVGLTSEDPSEALDAFDRLMATARVPTDLFHLLWTHDACVRARDSLHLDLILQNRLPAERLKSWIAESNDLSTAFADAHRIERAIYQASELRRDLKRFRDGVVNTERLGRGLRRWWYARTDGPRDADRTIRASASWEQWYRGLRDEPNWREIERWQKEGGRFTGNVAHSLSYTAAQMMDLCTRFRDVRLLGAALAKRADPSAPLWPDSEAFHTTLGVPASELAGSRFQWPSEYVRESDRVGGLATVSNSGWRRYIPFRYYFSASWNTQMPSFERWHEWSIKVTLPK